ncbi:MAG: HlyD family secretion protein [Deltaproteobacteria bacterium]|nr:MAG: HlyD family secretion protein [Deltaproteobacteria bacterium]
MSGSTAISMAPPAGQLPVTRWKRTPFLIAGLGAAAVLVSATWYLLHLGRESTDDAQVEGRVMTVSARVPGQVLRVRVDDNQVVEAGEVLVELDPADYAAKLDAARADLAAAQAAADGARSALALTEKAAPANLVQAQGGLIAASFSLISAEAEFEQARADLAAADSRQSLAELNLKRARALVESNVLPAADLDQRQTEFDAANAQYLRERARLAAALAGRAGSGGGVVLAKGRLSAAQTAAEQVASARAALALAEAKALQAEAALKLAELNLSYATVRAPRRGVVSRRSVEQGQTVGPERPLLAIVPLDDVWVVANFKEDQLAEMRAGQRTTVRLDTYGRREFHGHVESIAGATGARFALLPPDNATGNFVKVVQRIPVLIRLDGSAGVELRPGMSADVIVRTRD